MALVVVGTGKRTRGGWGFGPRRVGGGSPDEARWDVRKKERAAEGVRSPDLRKEEGWGFGQRRVGGGSPDDDRWDLRKRTRGSPDDARWDLQKKRREEERNGGGSPDLGKKGGVGSPDDVRWDLRKKRMGDDEEEEKKVVVVARVDAGKKKRREKWSSAMRVPWVEEGPHMLYAGPSFVCAAAPDPSSLPIPSFLTAAASPPSGGGVAVRVALLFVAGLVLRLRQLQRVRVSRLALLVLSQ